jgi:hypothetical protein
MRPPPGRLFRQHRSICTYEHIPSSTDQTILAADYARVIQELAEVCQQPESRTREQRESIQQQTATANLLKIISRSNCGQCLAHSRRVLLGF